MFRPLVGHLQVLQISHTVVFFHFMFFLINQMTVVSAVCCILFRQYAVCVICFPEYLIVL
jgi:hypothetical protein